MPLPEPEPGLVIRYDYLWAREATAREHGKERPSCLVAATAPETDPRFVVLLPITHTAPTGDVVGVEIPLRVRLAIGLDDEPCWVVVSEYNVDKWPSAGLAPLPGKPGTFSYGFLPPTLFARVRERFLALGRQGAGTGVRR